MQVSYKWLKSYIDFPYNPKELSKKLTMAGLEVEEMEYLGEGLDEIVVGEIISIKDHPNADKLVICNVDTGQETLQIITGAPNVKEGAKVPVANCGTILPNGMKIEKTKLRGKQSFGMICSEDELGLKDERQPGIMVLDENLNKGKSFVKEYGLDDYVYKLDLTPNYSRCLGMIGIAREIKAMIDNAEIDYPVAKIQETEENIKNMINIKIEDEELCNRYTGRIIKDVKIKESPEWMQRRLKAAGIRPINNIVDITNYVMLEYNQPLHAFDYDTIEGDSIIVRRAYEEEEIVTLDGEKRILNDSVLLITDKKKAIGMAGVMGGEISEVSSETKDIFLESAYFDPLNIRKTSSHYGIHSEASHRYERGIDIKGVVKASNRAAYLMQEYAEGKVVEDIIDKYPVVYKKEIIELEVERVNRILGIELSDKEIKNMLTKLEFEVDIYENSGLLKVKVPSYRVDVEQKADLIEEVARMYGYNNIPVTNPDRNQQGYRTIKQKNKNLIKDILVASGLDEIKTFSLMDKKIYDKLNITADERRRDWVKIKNPLSKAYEIMRSSLIPGTVKVLSNNKRRQLQQMGVFEIGRIYMNSGENKRPEEEVMIAGGSMGTNITAWDNNAPDFFYLKGILEELFQRLQINVEYIPGELDFLHPGRTAILKSNDDKLGFLGELLPSTISEFDLLEGTTIFQLSFDKLINNVKNIEKNYKPLPKFPAVNRDLAIVVNENIPVVKIKKIINDAGKKLLEEIELFDLYQGDQIPDDKKSLAFNLIFRSSERTLRDEDVNKVFENIINNLRDKIGADIRSK